GCAAADIRAGAGEFAADIECARRRATAGDHNCASQARRGAVAGGQGDSAVSVSARGRASQVRRGVVAGGQGDSAVSVSARGRASQARRSAVAGGQGDSAVSASARGRSCAARRGAVAGGQGDVVFAVGNQAIHAAKQATSTIPIVMLGADAVATGAVARLEEPSGNVTGVTYSSAELANSWLKLLKELRPTLSRVAVLYNADP